MPIIPMGDFGLTILKTNRQLIYGLAHIGGQKYRLGIHTDIYLRQLPTGTFEDHTAEMLVAIKRIGDALQASYEGNIAVMKVTAQPGVSFSPDQVASIKLLVSNGNIGAAQKLILDKLDDDLQ